MIDAGSAFESGTRQAVSFVISLAEFVTEQVNWR